MRKIPEVDYRKFRFHKLNTPEFSHLKLLLSWVVYLSAYILTERLIPRERCFVVYTTLDDIVPFCEYFVIAYVFWYFLIAGSLVYFLNYHIEGFKNLQKYIIITQIAAMVIYIVFPNRQDLRPESFERDNFYTRLIALLYSLDTNTNVCPSLHVGYSLGIASVWLKERDAHWTVKAFVVIAVILICLSTAFIKQHSVVDILVAIPMCVLAEWLVFQKKI